MEQKTNQLSSEAKREIEKAKREIEAGKFRTHEELKAEMDF